MLNPEYTGVIVFLNVICPRYSGFPGPILLSSPLPFCLLYYIMSEIAILVNIIIHLCCGKYFNNKSRII